MTNSTQTLTKDQLFQMTRLAWEPGLATTATHSSTGCERRLVIGNLSLVISYWSIFNEGWVIKTHLSLIRTILLLPLASSYNCPPPGGWRHPWNYLLAKKWVYPIEFCFAWFLPPQVGQFGFGSSIVLVFEAPQGLQFPTREMELVKFGEHLL